jgi:hypothetical protein
LLNPEVVFVGSCIKLLKLLVNIDAPGSADLVILVTLPVRVLSNPIKLPTADPSGLVIFSDDDRERMSSLPAIPPEVRVYADPIRAYFSAGVSPVPKIDILYS